MPPKNKTIYKCTECGYETVKWFGQCPSCNEWNCLEEQTFSVSKAGKSSKANIQALRLSEIDGIKEHRYLSEIKEFDRVLGGGLVRGSVVLLSGDPGIGKSTILLQVCENLAKNHKVLYVSGEESAHQLKLRASRLSVKSENILLLCDTDIEAICDLIRTERPGVVIVDSIQTMTISDIGSSAGSITQVRECTNMLTRNAKLLDIPIIIVGHVNKDGNIAGPKVLEHMVDTVLYFEGERHMSYRILRAAKNRFGSTNEIGVFEMQQRGLVEVENPSQMMLSGRPKNSPGSCVACIMEGSRPILAEVQGLVTPSGFGNPRRMATGFDYNRMNMLIAVLEKRAGYFLGNTDCYINVVGGLKIDEPACDLSVALALVSSLKDINVCEDAIAFGEIGLTGEIRSVSSCEQRIKEAARLGFSKCIISKHNIKSIGAQLKSEIEIIPVGFISEAFEAII